MTESADGIAFQDFSYYPSKDDPTTFLYIPGKPIYEVDQAGRPLLSLWVMGQEATLQVSTLWTVTNEQIEALRADIVVSNPQLTATQIRFSPAPITLEEVTLLLGDGAGNNEVLATAVPSGLPPYRAIFNKQLNNDQRERVIAALNGRPGFLMVTYHGTLAVDASAQTTIMGDVSTDVSELAQLATLSDTDSRARIEQALTEGRLTLTRRSTPNAPDDLRSQADEQAKAKASALLSQMARDTSMTMDASHLEALAVLHRTIPYPIEGTADVQSWFSGGEGANRVHVLQVSSDQ